MSIVYCNEEDFSTITPAFNLFAADRLVVIFAILLYSIRHFGSRTGFRSDRGSDHTIFPSGVGYRRWNGKRGNN
jgi:hypothetical protein